MLALSMFYNFIFKEIHGIPYPNVVVSTHTCAKQTTLIFVSMYIIYVQGMGIGVLCLQIMWKNKSLNVRFK